MPRVSSVMLRVSCPVDATIHYAGTEHAGKMLRCAKCGGPVPIGSSGVASSAQIAKKTKQTVPARWWPRSWGRIRLELKARSRLLTYAMLLTLVVMSVFTVAFRRKENSLSLSFAPPGAPKVLASPDSSQERPTVNLPGAPPFFLPRSGIPDTGPSRTLPTGTQIRANAHLGGRGVLNIDDSEGSDAEVKVVDQNSGRVIRDGFVEQGKTWECRGLREGSYTILFATGTDWDSGAKHFTKRQAFFEFGESLVFSEEPVEDGIRYSRYEITLYAQPAGKCPARINQ